MSVIYGEDPRAPSRARRTAPQTGGVRRQL